MHTAMLAAATATSSPTASLIGYIAQFGVVGLLLLDVGITRKVFVPRWTLDNERAERERERTDKDQRIADLLTSNNKLTDLAEQQVIPALTRATEVNKDYLSLLQARQRHD